MKKLLLLAFICVFARAETDYDTCFREITKEQKERLESIKKSLNYEYVPSNELLHMLDTDCEANYLLYGVIGAYELKACIALRDMLEDFGYPEGMIRPIDEGIKGAKKAFAEGLCVL